MIYEQQQQDSTMGQNGSGNGNNNNMFAQKWNKKSPINFKAQPNNNN